MKQSGIHNYMSKIDSLRPLLEEGSHSKQQKRIKNEIEGRDVSVVFDGSTRLRLVGRVLRFVSEGRIKQRLVKMSMLSGEELARELLTALSTKLNIGIGGNQLLAAMHNRASVNSVAMRTLNIIYSNVMDIGCFSHIP